LVTIYDFFYRRRRDLVHINNPGNYKCYLNFIIFLCLWKLFFVFLIIFFVILEKMKENKYKRELTQLMHVIVPSVVRELDFVEQMFW